MATVGPALTCNGYDPATGICTGGKSLPSYVAPENADSYLGSSYSTQNNAKAVVDLNDKGFWNGLLDFPFTKAFPSVTPNSVMTGASDTVAAVKNTSAGVGTLLGIVTDIPRVLTIVIGLMLLIAGLYALGNQSVVAAVKSIR